jgi:Fe-S-cluster containining protein
VSGDRCSGHCCREFTLTGIGETPEAIRAWLVARAEDGEQIADMVVPLRAIDVGVLAPDGRIVEEKPVGGVWIFTCRHYDAGTNNCLIYASRPRMCRDFPYGRPCEHGDRCTWGAGRIGAWPLTFSSAVWRDGSDISSRRWHLRVLQEGGRDSQKRDIRIASLADAPKVDKSEDVAT